MILKTGRTKVNDFDFACLSLEQDVFWLEVAMNDLRASEDAQCIQYLQHMLQKLNKTRLCTHRVEADTAIEIEIESQSVVAILIQTSKCCKRNLAKAYLRQKDSQESH